MHELLNNHSLVLMEAAIVERLRRAAGVELHPVLVNAPLIYQQAGREAMREIYEEYCDIALEAKTPFLMCTPTWRTNRQRVSDTGINESINRDAVHFLQAIRESHPHAQDNIRIGGMIGCKNDCYRPGESLTVQEAEQFHAWQIAELAEGGVDFIIAETLPAVEEAIGIARAAERSGLPYFISFVISRDGRVLDGAPLDEAIKRVDAATGIQALGYLVNCAYPTFLCAASQPPALFERLIGYLANASSLDQCELDGAAELMAESVSEWGDSMLELHTNYGLKILGGCCGTNVRHLRYLADTGVDSGVHSGKQS
ncbi:MAG: homocysteine S-methyltransferase family protein [Lysobacterales bacterium]